MKKISAQKQAYKVLCVAVALTQWDQATPGDPHSSLFGRAVSIVGDLDGDGQPDFAVGAPGASREGGRRGAVVFVSSKSRKVVGRIDGAIGRTLFGWNVHNVGDLDSDGSPEILVGSHAWLESDQATLVSPKNGEVLWTTQAPSFFEGVVGDLNGDGVVDLFVRGYRNAILSGSDGKVLDGFLDRSGRPLMLVGDVSGDETPEFAVIPGSPQQDIEILSPPNWSEAGNLVLPHGSMESLVGIHVQVADVDMDGADDYLVGLPSWDAGTDATEAHKTGLVLVYSGMDNSLLYELAPQSSEPWDFEFGFSLASAGDIDGDGGVDFVVGAPGLMESSVGLYSGMTGKQVWRKVYAEGMAMVGVDLELIPDMDSDDVPEILVGGSDHSFHGTFFSGGSIRVLSGKTGRELFSVLGKRLPELSPGEPLQR